jgi:hypothetical protein
MVDLRENIGGNATAGVVIGLAGTLNKLIVYGTPVYDMIVGTLGRWGEPAFAVIMGFVLDFLDERVPVLEQWRVPSRWFIYGVMRFVDEAVGMVMGKGFAYIKSDGSIATDPADTITAVYVQSGGTVSKVQPGQRTGGFGVNHYVAVGGKAVYYFMAPYKLPVATA